MSIIVSQGGKGAKRIDKLGFEKEDELQNYIHENPESIPVYEIQEDKKLFVAAREFPTASGPIDALAFDKDGDIYVIETKLYKNPDKRTVVAQALDYGASLWRHSDYDEFMRGLNSETEKKFKSGFTEKIKDFFGLDDDQALVALDSIRRNLSQGNIKFVILMDSMDDRLKDLIVYVNQNSQFDIYAVQMEYYKFESYEIMIPKIFGVEVKKNMGAPTPRVSWTEKDFLEDAASNSDQSVFDAVRELHDFCKRSKGKITYGSGKNGLFSLKVDSEGSTIIPFRLGSSGLLVFPFDYLMVKKESLKDKVYDFVSRLDKIEGADIRDGNEFERSEVYFEISDVKDKERFINEIETELSKFVDEIS